MSSWQPEGKRGDWGRGVDWGEGVTGGGGQGGLVREELNLIIISVTSTEYVVCRI